MIFDLGDFDEDFSMFWVQDHNIIFKDWLLKENLGLCEACYIIGLIFSTILKLFESKLFGINLIKIKFGILNNYLNLEILESP